MSIHLKRDQTKKLKDLIKNEKEQLLSREKDVKDDWNLI
jgi:hypothetical protein